jgi:beta-lactamase superfamily II metal-dependent hydrolase
MYNVGFGDCFLLAFRGDHGKARYMLIDCGSYSTWKHGDEKAKDRLIRVAADIRQATGKHLHVVALTHQHWDHVMGFYHGSATFKDMKMDDLWLGWPENEPGKDEDADRLREELGKQIQQFKALRAAAEVLTVEVEENPLAGELARAIEGILAFSDEALAPEDVLLGASGQYNTTAQYTFLKEHVKNEPVYLKPRSPEPEGEPQPATDPVPLPGVNGVEVYALGPPTGISKIKQMEPPAGTHLGAPVLDEWTAFSIAALVSARKGGVDKLEEDEKRAYWRSLPFERRSPHRILLRDLEREPVSDEKGVDETLTKCRDFYEKHYLSPAWQRIDTEWLAGALQILLKVSALQNNTSLVMAIRFRDSERVLLFAGDAQYGNWRSWTETSWTLEDEDGEKKTITGNDLIRETVFYKVGHHGSHNATLPDYVEKMDDDLVAMIPVDAKWAAKKGWKHPYVEVLTVLGRKTKGRIIRSDTGVLTEKPDWLSDDEWQEFEEDLKDWSKQVVKGPDGLWIQYTVPG